LPTGKTKFTPKLGLLMLKHLGHLNIYRTRFQLDEKRLQAIAAYQQLHNFPDAKETGTALLQLANMANQRCLTYLDQVISRFPIRRARR